MIIRTLVISNKNAQHNKFTNNISFTYSYRYIASVELIFILINSAINFPVFELAQH